MKKIFFLVMALFAGLFLSCSQVIESNDSGLSVTLPGGEGRSVVYSPDVYHFEVTVEGESYVFKEAQPGETVKFTNLKPGSYTVTVEGIRQDGSPVFSGIKNCELKSGSSKVSVKIEPSDVVSSVLMNGREYASLKEAFDNISTTGDFSITLQGNAVIDSYMAVPAAAKINLDLNGYSLFVKPYDGSDKNENGMDVIRTCYFDVNKEGASLGIINGYIFGCGTIDRILFRSGVVLDIENIKISGIKSKTALLYSGGGIVNFRDCSICNCAVLKDKNYETVHDDMKNSSLIQFLNSNLNMVNTCIEKCYSEYGNVIKFEGSENSMASALIISSKILQSEKSLNPAVILCGKGNDTTSDTFMLCESEIYGKKTALKLEGVCLLAVTPLDQAEMVNSYLMSDSDTPFIYETTALIADTYKILKVNGKSFNE